MKITNWTISSLLILINLYFIPLSFITIRKSGGPMGYGLLILPISVSINLLLIFSGLTFKKRFNRSIGLLVINSIGLVWAAFWLWVLLTTPKID
jgi:hypothetical protein